MSDDRPSIGVMFDRKSLRVPELLAAASDAMRKGAAARAAAISPTFWPASAQRVLDLIDKLVDVPLTDVLTGAWKVNRQFTRYTDKTKYPAGKESTVELLTHHIKSSYEPYVRLTLDGEPAGKIDFRLELDVTLKAGTLTIESGKFRRLEAGKCEVTGTLSCEGQEITQRTFHEFAWKDGISLGARGEGIPIEAVV
jgi:hypothetical protein